MSGCVQRCAARSDARGYPIARVRGVCMYIYIYIYI